MLSADDRRRVSVVLVRARNPNNIGAVARAMHDFGFRELRLAGEYEVALEGARSAVDAGAVVRGAVWAREIGEAIAGCTLVLGTTAVGERALEHPVETLAAASERIAVHLAANPAHRVGLLFGSEKTGLSNKELSHCDGLVTIPMEMHAGVRHPSMNLGQAAAVCLYELVRGWPIARVAPAAAIANAGEMERLREVFEEVLRASGYMRRHPANSDRSQVRRLLLRTRPTAKDLPVWMGVLRQMLWRMSAVTEKEEPRGAPAASGQTDRDVK